MKILHNINSLHKNSPPKNFLFAFEKLARSKLVKRYDKPLSFHDTKIINDIIYNEKTHFVELFKENLIFEDINEFLRKFYTKPEITQKLKKILIFYEKFSKIYANYTILPESKYMYKNIKRKQKMIDLMQDEEEEEEEEEENSNYTCIFTTNAMNSINSLTLSLKLNNNNDTKSEKSIQKVINQIALFENKPKSKLKNTNKNKFSSKYIISNYNSTKNLSIAKNKNKKTSSDKNLDKKPLSPKIIQRKNQKSPQPKKQHLQKQTPFERQPHQQMRKNAPQH